MSEFKDRLKYAIQFRNIKQKDLCEITGIPKSAMSLYISGAYEPKRNRAVSIAKALNVSVAWLRGCFDNVDDEDLLDLVNLIDNDILEKYGNDLDSAYIEQLKRDEEQSLKDARIILNTKPVKENPLKDEPTNISAIIPHLHNVPVFESVSAGFGAYSSNDIVDYIPVVIKNPADVDDTIAIKVVGDSMYPKIENGDIIIVRRQESVDSGDIGVILLDGDEGLVKKIVYGKDWIELISLNPEYQTKRFEGADVLRLRVVGKVKQIVKML